MAAGGQRKDGQAEPAASRPGPPRLILEVRLDGRVAIVTGASAGGGRAIGQAIAEAGAAVMLVARHEQPLREAAHGIVAAYAGGQLDVFTADVARPADAQACVEATIKRFGAV